MFVPGTCGPYATLFTNSQSPTSNVGIMLPEGMRYASRQNVRMTRKMASVVRIAMKLSHPPPFDRRPFFPDRSAATLPCPVSGVLRFDGTSSDLEREGSD